MSKPSGQNIARFASVLHEKQKKKNQKLNTTMATQNATMYRYDLRYLKHPQVYESDQSRDYTSTKQANVQTQTLE